jgi:CTP:molybdopterin cytidylyltransferase MocA
MVAGLLLAAGGGSRYGRPKALVRLGGRLLVESATDVLRGAGCAPVVVVLGAAAEEVLAIADLGDAIVVHNPDWVTGMGSSLRAGLACLTCTTVEATVVTLVDMPGVTSSAVLRTAQHSSRSSLAVSTYHGKRGHPVLLGRDHWAGVAESALGDVGARPYLTAHAAEVASVACEDVADPTDLDLPGLTDA